MPPELFRQLGSITRLLRDTMQQPGVMPRLQVAADGLPDECSRLGCIANETAAAAEKVLNPVDQAKLDQAHIAASTRRMAEAIVADPGEAVAQGTAMNFVPDVEQTTARIDGDFTDILRAMVFDDLTGQVVAKVVTLANDLESSLVELLVSVVPPEQRETACGSVLHGPLVDPAGRAHVVGSRGEADDLLASLGVMKEPKLTCRGCPSVRSRG